MNIREHLGHIIQHAKAAEREWDAAHEWPISEKNRVYHERNQLVALLARLYPSGIRRTEFEGWDPEWHNYVYIDTPAGQLSWHYHETEAPLFVDLPFYIPGWDGHTTEQKYERVQRLMGMRPIGQESLRARVTTEAIAAVLTDGNPLHLAYSEHWRIPDVAEKIASLFNREEVMPTVRSAPTSGNRAVDTPPPSARSQAGAFVPSEICIDVALKAWVDSLTVKMNEAGVTWPRAEENIKNNIIGHMTKALNAAFSYAQKCGAIAPSPAEPPAATVEEIAAVIKKCLSAYTSVGDWTEMGAREIAALRPAPAGPEGEHADVAELCDMLARSADRMENSYSETASIARRARDVIRRLIATKPARPPT